MALYYKALRAQTAEAQHRLLANVILHTSTRQYQSIRQPITRRTLLKLGASSLLLPFGGSASRARSFCLGVIADLHHGLAPRAMERLESFMQAVHERRPDAIIQLGDFNFGMPESTECTDLWRTFKGPRYHVLGNHDMDFATKDAMVQTWQMRGRYYSFDLGPYQAVVLDRNNLKTGDGFKPYASANFYVDASMRGYADSAQLEWLRAELSAADRPIVVFVHQGLGMRTSMPGSAQAIEAVLEQHNRSLPSNKVVACICGHHHIDRYVHKSGIHYLWVNSASYYWVGEAYGRMAPYTRALYTFMTFHADGLIEVEACQAGWEAPTPQDRGFPRAEELTPYIQARRLMI